MDWKLLAIVALASYALGWVMGRASRPPRDLSGPPPARQRPPRDLDMATRERIERELAAGNKIAAIHLMRDATGMGLKDSKEAVEAMEPARAR